MLIEFDAWISDCLQSIIDDWKMLLQQNFCPSHFRFYSVRIGYIDVTSTMLVTDVGDKMCWWPKNFIVVLLAQKFDQAYILTRGRIEIKAQLLKTNLDGS